MNTGEIIDGKYRQKDTNTKEFWQPVLNDETFNSWITKRYSISSVDGIMRDELSEQDIDAAYKEV
jgi:hypothetical protein